ncbi:hypothetical protein [Streptomyces sp. NBC_00887]|uniref:hypothetical protein n=1 Tax=Streptomyces sp. NBC_00887 TaxID=2975859 RepID=UPI00386AE67D|nr:hypothetical protein OG844_00160 [Streptomyces sp. NBC_00887]WSY36379.1 hypothetical protein OG844_45435 [Streptomyces sp. NBC_00887]
MTAPMLSDIESIQPFSSALAPTPDTACSAHGWKACQRPLVAEAVLREPSGTLVRYRRVCRHWLTTQIKAAQYLDERRIALPD